MRLTDLSATALVARWEVTAVEAHRRRIEAVEPAINAVVALDAEQARTRPAGPLGGVPFTVKDNLEAAGPPMAIGAPERAGAATDRGAGRTRRRRDRPGRRGDPRGVPDADTLAALEQAPAILRDAGAIAEPAAPHGAYPPCRL